MSIPSNSISDFVNSIEIKHKDIPHILILLTIIFGATLAGWVYFGLTGLITAAIISVSYIFISLQYHLYRANQTNLMYQQQRIQDYLTLFNAIDFRRPLPYMTGFAASPELARVVYENVVEHKPSLVVELGSGVTSIIAGYGLDQIGAGSLLSIDHDKKYLKQTEVFLQDHRLDKLANLKYCPLTVQTVNGNQSIWYDLSSISFNKPIDLLLIDGPPEETQYKARYPALPLLYPYLNDSAIIIIDDVKRETGRKTVQEWVDEYNDLSFRLIDTEKGIGIFNR